MWSGGQHLIRLWQQSWGNDIHLEGTLFTSEYCPRRDNIHQGGTLFTSEYCPGGHYSLENNVLGDTSEGRHPTLWQWYTMYTQVQARYDTDHYSFAHCWPADSRWSSYTGMNQQCCCTRVHKNWDADTHLHLRTAKMKMTLQCKHCVKMYSMCIC